MTTVVLGVGMFTFTIVALVGLLMLARRQLVATGDVTITVNGDPEKALQTSAGGTLLGTLAANRIFIPSACGGKGSCGVCTVTVCEGGTGEAKGRRAATRERRTAKAAGGTRAHTRSATSAARSDGSASSSALATPPTLNVSHQVTRPMIRLQCLHNIFQKVVVRCRVTIG